MIRMIEQINLSGNPMNNLQRFYFITYQATNKQGSTSICNQVINNSPMEFITHIAEVEWKGSNTYNNFVIINTCEISKAQYEYWKYKF